MNPFDLFRNMNQIKGQAEALKAKIATIRCTGYAGGNMVEAVANGMMEIESVKIDPTYVKPEYADFLQVMVTSAVNTALKNVKDRIQEESGEVLSQYGISL